MKIAPDINKQTLNSIIETAHSQKIFGLIISNTTLDRKSNLKSKKSDELGGLSGKPLFKKSTDILSQANKIIKNNNYKLVIPRPLRINKKIISSTEIRKLLSNGNLAKANKYLSRNWEIEGIVERGRKVGGQDRICNMQY